MNESMAAFLPAGPVHLPERTAGHLEGQVQKPPLSVETRTWFNPNQLTLWYFCPRDPGAHELAQVILLAGMSVARERGKDF